MSKMLLVRNLDRKKAKLDELEYLGRDSGKLKFRVTLTQGLNRQIRRLIGRAGYTVSRLKRISHGAYDLGDLKPGKSRKINL